MSDRHRRKKSFPRRIKHHFKSFSRKYWGICLTILLAIFTAFWLMPGIIRFFSGEE